MTMLYGIALFAGVLIIGWGIGEEGLGGVLQAVVLLSIYALVKWIFF